jgi:hypothetical protein
MGLARRYLKWVTGLGSWLQGQEKKGKKYFPDLIPQNQACYRTELFGEGEAPGKTFCIPFLLARHILRKLVRYGTCQCSSLKVCRV